MFIESSSINIFRVGYNYRMKVLFICNSNVFRSQMAEAFFNKYTKKSIAKSAALIKPQEKMHALVVRAMEVKGIDISNNISKIINQQMVDRADLVVLFESELKRNFKFNKKIEVWNVPDVVAKEKDERLYIEFVKVRDMIEEKVKELLFRIE